MAIRKILLPLQSATTAEAAFSTAATVARLWCAHLAVLHVSVDGSRERAIREVFNRMVSENDLFLAKPSPNADRPTVSLTMAVGREVDTVAYQARLADLIVVPHQVADELASSTHALHAVLFDSAQPVLIAPRTALRSIGTRMCLGWNGTAESASAVLSAMPWLHRAQARRILWSEDYQRSGPRAPDLENYLAAHELPVDWVEFRPINNVVGAGLLAAAHEFACDLLVMGAYSHSRFRQLILGGVTRHVLENAAVPVMMHR